MDSLHWWHQGDAVTQATALLLLAMSVASWVVIAWKLLFLRRARGDVVRCMAAFWQAPSLEVAQQTLVSLDREALVLPMVAALYSINDEAPARSLGALGPKTQQLTRVLRGALHGALARLQFGQVSLTAIAGAWQISIDRVAGPVGEALVMTAAGLAVAIPAVLAYNWFGRMIGHIEADLEGFALDLRDWQAPAPQGSP